MYTNTLCLKYNNTYAEVEVGTNNDLHFCVYLPSLSSTLHHKKWN